MKPFSKITQIDLSPLWKRSDAGLQQVADELRKAYTTAGFAYLINHRIPDVLTKAVFQAAKDFHALPLEEKMKIKQNQFFRGYVPINAPMLKVSTLGAATKANQSAAFTLKVSTLGAATKANQSAAFVLAHEVAEDDPDYLAACNLAGPNQWPENLPGFKTVVTDYQQHMITLAEEIVRAFSVSFGMLADHLDQYFVNPTHFFRLQYYPKQPGSIPSDQFGIAPHTDYGFLTLLAQDENGGLQVQNQGGDWVDVPYLPNSLVLNSGDMLKRMSNDRYIATLHRVINRSGNARSSIPFFFDTNMHAVISPLSSCINTENPAKYPPIEYAEHALELELHNKRSHVNEKPEYQD